MTPAQRAGFVIGKQYRITDNDYGTGTVVTFKRDDGTGSPAFDCPYEYDGDGWVFISLERLSPVEESAATPLKNFIIDVTDVETTVRVGKRLNADQLKRIIEILGE